MISADELVCPNESAVRRNGYCVDAAVAVHKDIVRIYEQTYNAHTFDFEKDVGRFMSADVTVVSAGVLGGRSLLREMSEARADYVQGAGAVVMIDSQIINVTDLGGTAVLVVEGGVTFTYPDDTVYTQRLLASATLRFLDGAWVYQHIHFANSW